MDDEKRIKGIPPWAWVLGCLALLVACAVTVALGATMVGLFVIDRNTLEVGSPEISLAEATVVEEPEASATPFEAATETVATETASPEPASSPTGIATETPQPSPEASPTAAAAVDDPFADERATIEANVVVIRELEPKEAVNPVSLTSTELRQRLEDDFLEEYGPEEARQDAITLSAFDFMAPDFDLYNYIVDLLTEQIAGFYDAETDEFVTISDDDQFDPLEQLTHAHEYVHALQDQHYNLEMLDDETLDSEAAFAIQALAEGDATLVQTRYLMGGYFDQGQLLELMESALGVDTAVFDSAPPIIARELEFPYLTGMEFVQALYNQGGFEAIDSAWNNLPQSTEHILHPQRYLEGDAPQIVSLAPLTDTLGAGWQMTDEDVLGEFYLREYLDQQLSNVAVDQAATGWGGDRYAVYWNEANQAPVMVLKLAWDTPGDAEEFAEHYPLYPGRLFGSDAQPQAGGACWSGDDVICFYSSAGESLIVRAPDLETAARVAAVQQGGG